MKVKEIVEWLKLVDQELPIQIKKLDKFLDDKAIAHQKIFLRQDRESVKLFWDWEEKYEG